MSETIGWIALGLAALVGARNFYCGFVRGPLYRWFGWEYRWDSGLPAIGSLCLIVALACLWDVHWVRIAGAVLAVIDTAGIPWFIVVMVVMAVVSASRAPDGDKYIETAGPRPPWTWLTPTLLLALLAMILFVVVAFNAGWFQSMRE